MFGQFVRVKRKGNPRRLHILGVLPMGMNRWEILEPR
jgi:hypothetical protein